MKNVPSFVTGIIVTALAVVLLFMPTSDVFLFKTMHVIGVWVNLIAGILLVMGGIWNNKNSSGSGFGIGMAAWTLIIITSIFDMIWNLDKINSYQPWETITLYFAFQDFPWNFVPDMAMHILYTNSSNLYQISLISSIFGLCFGAACLILGSISASQVLRMPPTGTRPVAPWNRHTLAWCQVLLLGFQ